MATYLITGGNGFIGHHISSQLVEQGNKVVTYDIDRCWIHPSKSLHEGYLNLRKKQLGDKVTRVYGDTTDKKMFLDTLNKVMPNYVIHLAALPLAGKSNESADDAKTTILDATKVVLECISEHMKMNPDFKRFTFTSSSMVYGDFQTFNGSAPVPARESDLLDPKKSLYATYKAMGEMLVKSYAHVFGIPFSIVRPSAVYGPTDANRRVTEIFVNNALTGKPLKLENGGTNMLDFTYVKDIASGFILAASHPEAEGHTYNITTGNARSLKELAEVIAAIVPGTEIQLSDETDKFRPARGTLDISKAKSISGYMPKYTLETGMQEYIEFVVNAGVLQGIKPEIIEKFKKG